MRKKRMASGGLYQTTIVFLCLISWVCAGDDDVPKKYVADLPDVSGSTVVPMELVTGLQAVSETPLVPKEYVPEFRARSDIAVAPVAIDVQVDISVENLLADQAATNSLDLVFVIHTSTAVKKNTFTFYKQFLRDIVKDANIDEGNVRVSLISYKKKPSLVFNLKKYSTKANLLNDIDNLKQSPAKDGNIIAALDFVRTKVFTDKAGDRPEVPNVIVLLTDAVSRADVRKLHTAAQAVKDAGSKIYAVGVGLQDASQLQRIVSSPTNIYIPKSFDDLAMVSEEIVKAEPALQQQDAPSVDETLTADNSDKVDLAIVFHLSTDIKPAEIKRYFVPLVTAIVEKAQIDSGNVRIALINYAKRARTKFNLAKYRTSAEVIKEIQSIDGGDRAKKSSGGSAFNEVRTDIFTSKGGDRPDAPNAVILITDDKNSDDQEQFVQEAEALKRAGVKIITVGMESANVDELRAVSSDPAVKNAIFAKTYVTAFSSDVVEQVRNTLAGLQERRAPPGRPEPEPERPTTASAYH